jgi:hypothetical protein
MPTKHTVYLGQPQDSRGSADNEQKKRQPDNVDLIKGVQGLSVRRNGRSSPLNTTPSSNQPARSQTPTHASSSTTHLCKQNSCSTGTSPFHLPIKPVQSRPGFTTFGTTTESNRRVPRRSKDTLQFPSTGGVKKVSGPDRKGPNREPLDCKIDYRSPSPSSDPPGEPLWLLVHSRANGPESWSFFLDRGGHRKIHSYLVGGPGNWQYRERLGVEPTLRNRLTNIFVDHIRPEHVESYREIVASANLAPDNNAWRPEDWCMNALQMLYIHPIIDANIEEVREGALERP